jgi:bla regulator protein BlaR1
MSNTLTNLFVLVLQASFIASVLAVAVWLICRKAQLFITPTLAITLWTLVLLRLFVVSGPASNLSLSNWLPQTASGWQQTPFSVRTNLNLDVTLANNDKTQTKRIERARTSSSWSATNWLLCIASVWIGVAFVLLARLHYKAVRGRAMLAADSFPVDKLLLAIYDECQTSLGIPCRPRLIVSNHVSVPAIVGLLRPLIVVPEWCQRELSRDQLRLILTHELVHYRRCDLWRQWLYCLVSAIHWFNPLVNRIIHRLLELHEVACDRRVVAVAAAAWSLPTRMYGETILQLAARADDGCIAKGVCSTSNLAIGFVRDGCSLKERIQMLTKNQNGYR